MFKDPETPNHEQFEYVQNAFNRAEAALYGTNFLDPEMGYRNYIDVESFLKYYVVQELSKNCDGNMRGSCYLALKSDGKVYQPFVWDFDIAFGNANHITWEQGASSTGPDGWYIKTCSPWFNRFFMDPAFVAELKEKWNTLKPQLDKLPDYIQQQADQLKYAAARNFRAVSAGGAGWSLHDEIWPNYQDRGSYAAEVAFLKNFVTTRLKWLDENINGLE
jgi:spore coat protein CotH